MLNKLCILLFSISILLFSCEKEAMPGDCPEDIICTAVFVTVTIPVDWVTMRPEGIKRSETIIAESGKILATFEDYQNNPGIPFYGIQVVNDLHIPSLKTDGTDLIVRVYGTTNNLLKEFTCTAGHDCCHVVKIKGPDKLAL